MRYCRNCNSPITDVTDPNVVCKTKCITQKGSSSSGCSMSRFWYCSANCAPKSDEELPPVNCHMIVGAVINCDTK